MPTEKNNAAVHEKILVVTFWISKWQENDIEKNAIYYQ